MAGVGRLHPPRGRAPGRAAGSGHRRAHRRALQRGRGGHRLSGRRRHGLDLEPGPDPRGGRPPSPARPWRSTTTWSWRRPSTSCARPLWGRNFETYSEDPFLAGALGAAYVEGLQGEGVGASLKHYAVNNQEEGRMTVNVVVDERTLREIYLAAFETVVKTANPWTVMASYNKINGAYATENQRLLDDILKGEWGYDGVVVSDWGAVHATAAAANGGNDLEMPGPARWFGDKLLAAVKAGEVPEAPDRRRRPPHGAPDPAHRRPGRQARAGRRTALQAPPPDRRARRRGGGGAAEERRAICCRSSRRTLRTVAVVGPNARGAAHPGRRLVPRATGPADLDAAGDRGAAGRPGARWCTPRAATTSPSRRRRARRCSVPTRPAARPACLVEYFAERELRGAPYPYPDRARDRQAGLDQLRAARWESGLGALRWTGWFWPERDGRHEFSLRAPGAGRLVLDGEVLIDEATPAAHDNWDVGGMPAPRRIAAADLVAGRGYPDQHRIRPARRTPTASPGNMSPSACVSRRDRSRRRPPWRPPARTRPSWSSARPRSARARATTAPTSNCPATRTPWSKRCWRPIRARSSCWWTARPTPCRGSTTPRRCWRPGWAARRGRTRSRASCSATPNRRAACR